MKNYPLFTFYFNFRRNAAELHNTHKFTTQNMEEISLEENHT